MKPGIFNTPLMALGVLFIINIPCFAQEISSLRSADEVLPAKVAAAAMLNIPNEKDIEQQVTCIIDKVKTEKKVRIINRTVIRKATREAKEALKSVDKELKYAIPAVALAYAESGNNLVMQSNPDLQGGGQGDQDVSYKEAIKNYTKVYTVDANDKLVIDNRYGKVSINTWNRNEFKVDVQIKVTGNDENDTKKFLDNVTIEDEKEGSTVSFQTKIAKDNQWAVIMGNNKKPTFRKMEINYTVYMPSKNPLDITNRYGTIELADFDGKVVINCTNTNLVARSLTNIANEINVAYGNINIASLRASDINLSYGDLTLDWADKINADIVSGSVKIGKISTSGVINLKYVSGMQIGDVGKNMKNLQINSAYSNVKLGLGDNENADFDVNINNGNFSFGNHAVSISRTAPNTNTWTTKKTYKGRLGKGDTDKLISINSSFGNVKFE